MKRQSWPSPRQSRPEGTTTAASWASSMLLGSVFQRSRPRSSHHSTRGSLSSHNSSSTSERPDPKPILTSKTRITPSRVETSLHRRRKLQSARKPTTTRTSSRSSGGLTRSTNASSRRSTTKPCSSWLSSRRATKESSMSPTRRWSDEAQPEDQSPEVHQRLVDLLPGSTAEKQVRRGTRLAVL